MDLTTIYAVNQHGMFRPAVVLDRGKAPDKVTVCRYWKWPDDVDNYLNPTPDLTDPTAKSEVVKVRTGDVWGTWANYCAHRRQVAAEALALLQESEARAERAKSDVVARIDGVRDLLNAQQVGTGRALIDHEYIRSLALTDRLHDTRFSAKHILELVEAIAARFDTHVHVEREGQ